MQGPKRVCGVTSGRLCGSVARTASRARPSIVSAVMSASTPERSRTRLCRSRMPARSAPGAPKRTSFINGSQSFEMLDRQNSSFAQLRSAVNCARRWRAIEICQLPGAVMVPKSRIFGATVGCSVPAASFSKHDYLIDPSRFASKGNWAFCRFTSEEVPAARLGFQRGGFNGGSADLTPSPQYLQLHLELMTREGAILWLPSGIYPAGRVRTDPHTMNIELEHRGRKIFSFRGWPKIECHFCSEDGAAQADLQFDLTAVTVLPDCILPHCLFGMWECMGGVSGSVRSADRTIAVAGKVFF